MSRALNSRFMVRHYIMIIFAVRLKIRKELYEIVMYSSRIQEGKSVNGLQNH
ncbi:MAG: hypothetical protein JG782_1746 [Anaerophaga sp.]|nr:hypothetical protein [Anaerophaga sp.]MDK2842139.1 hypothetical protein [Anaerophaga sp.]MDN5291616.1 hypothetical protein [Anaerophaga sp.]